MDITTNKELFQQSLLYKVAWLYYIEQLTQKEIGDKLSLTRVKVNKMLEEAREKKIVHFHFSTFNRNKIEVERDLIEKYQLKDVFVAPWSTDENINESLAQAAAMYLDDLLEDNATISMGYGDTMGKIIENFTRISNKNLSIISMTGGVAPYLPRPNVGTFKTRLHLTPAPLIMSTKETATDILNEQSVRDVFDLAELSQISVVGIGGMNEHSTVLSTHILSQSEYEKLKIKNAVGDILMHFINSDGIPVDSEIEERLISTKLDQLKEKDNVIAVAGGQYKIEPIYAAISNGYIDTLITDEETAKSLLGR